MRWKKGLILGMIIADVLAVNAGVGYLFYKYSIFNSNFSINSQFSNTNNSISLTDELQVVDECGEKCRKYIETKIAEAAGPSAQPKVSITPTASEKVTKTTTPPPTARAKVRSVQYITIPGSGFSTKNAWEDLAGTEFYFDKADYPGLVEVYFESNMKLFNGNGSAFVQLFDATHGVGVQGSDVQTKNQVNTVVTSGQVTFWAGKNLVRVQAKSLTADTTIYNSGRLKLILEN